MAGKATLLHDHPNYAGPIGVTGSIGGQRRGGAGRRRSLPSGTRLQDFTTGSWALFEDPDVRFVSINTAGWDAHKHRALPVIGDARVSLEALDVALGAATADGEWLAFAQAQIADWHRYLDSWKGRSHDGPPAYAEVIATINEVCDDDDYCLSAAGGLPGELCHGLALEVGRLVRLRVRLLDDGLRDRRRLGRQDGQGRAATSSSGSATART